MSSGVGFSYLCPLPGVKKSKRIIKGPMNSMYIIEYITKKTEIKNKIATMLPIITVPLKFDNSIISQKCKTWQKQL